MSMTSSKSPSKVLSPKNVDAERDHVRLYTLKRLKLGDGATEILVLYWEIAHCFLVHLCLQ